MLLLVIALCVLASLALGVLPIAAWLLIAKPPRELDWSHACLPGHAHNPVPRDGDSRDGWCTFCHARYVERVPLIHGRPHDARMAQDHEVPHPRN